MGGGGGGREGGGGGGGGRGGLELSVQPSIPPVNTVTRASQMESL